MPDLVQSYAPNNIGGRVAANAVTTWQLIGMVAGAPNSPIGYDTYAALVAAGSVVWPALEGGAQLQSLYVRSDNGTGSDGSAMYAASPGGSTAAPTDDTAQKLISGSGQTVLDAGAFRLLWIRKQTASDRIVLSGSY